MDAPKCEGTAQNAVCTPQPRRGRKRVVPWRFQLEYVRWRGEVPSSVNSMVDLDTACRFALQRRRHKALVPWRFQREFKRQFGRSVGPCKEFLERSELSKLMACSSRNALEKPLLQKSECVFSDEERSDVTAQDVQRQLREFREIYHRVYSEIKGKERGPPDLTALRIFKERNKGVGDCGKYVGNVPGVHVGSVFLHRVELCLVGLHRQTRAGIDVVPQDGQDVAVGIVVYSTQPNDRFSLELVVYTAPTTATLGQKIDGANLALKRSMDIQSPVRVICGFKKNKVCTYVYCGLYTVQKYLREKLTAGGVAYKFHLRRIAGQPTFDVREVLKIRWPEPEASSASQVLDLSRRLEKIPIGVVNAVDGEHLKPFKYIVKLKYPLKHLPDLPTGCDCTDGCTDSQKCACAVKNGGEIPFNHEGLIIQAKPLVYECGPFCQCPQTCHNRVSQHGIKFRLQIFKTNVMGWGVRSMDFIPSGSFVCQYVGEVLEEEEAQKRTTDEYIFAIGNNYYDETLWEGLPKSIPSLQKGLSEDNEDIGFAIDASECGNVARFINHSCTPNMYAQNVLYDHDKKSMPHVMFFASEDISPLQELSYHYNYTIDAVHDSNGNIKKKECYCGSHECTGWLY